MSLEFTVTFSALRKPIAEKKISPDDLEMLFVTDSPAEAVAHVVECQPKRSATRRPTPEGDSA